jgi:hypothetical protein
VRSRAEEIQAQKQQKQKGQEGQKKSDRKRILQALQHYPKGETCSVLAQSAGLSGGRARLALDQLVDEEKLMRAIVTKGGKFPETSNWTSLPRARGQLLSTARTV